MGDFMDKIYQPFEKLSKGILNKDGIILDKCTSSWSAPVHKHNFIELVYTFSGSVTHYVNGKEFNASRGDLIIINYNQTHEFTVHDEMTFCNILIEPSFLCEELINSFNALDILKLSIFSDFSDQTQALLPYIHFENEALINFEQLINTMVNEFETKAIGYKSILKSMCEQMFIYILRQMHSYDINIHLFEQIDTLSPQILKYIETESLEKISMTEYAKRCCYSPAYFSRIFKKCFGCTFTDFVKHTRIEKAKELLLNTSYSIDEIMNNVGYSDKKQFYKVFAEKCNTTPGEYRKNKK